MSNYKIAHEKYHLKTKYQKKVIKDNNFTYRILIDVINRNLQSGKKILDIGCGAGTLSFYLANKGYDVFGIDISSKAIKQCVTSKKELGFENINFEQLDFPKEYPNEKYDVILFTEVIEHLEDDTEALEVISKMLNMDGTMILSTPSNKAPLHRLGLTKKFDKEVGHLRRYSINELELLIKKSDFKIISQKKTEGILRNFLFVNPVAGKLVRFLNYSRILSATATIFDNFTLKLFGESNIIIVARKA